MIEKEKPIEYNEHLCFKCLQNKENIHTYTLSSRGYGSIFDNGYTKLQLCDDCNQKELKDYFNEIPKMDEYCENYLHEEDILKFINTLPIQGKELFENSCSNSGWIKPQDWIDIELGIALDETYKKYNMYSPSEIKAYEERFPTCKQVYKKVYPDGSAGCLCNYGAYGNSDGSTSRNISDKCYYCKKYEKRINDMEVVYEPIIHKSDIKLVTMQEWICPKCGNINHTYDYLEEDYYNCGRCFEAFTLVE